MNVVVAIDSLKGSLTSMEAGYAAEKGVKRICPEAKVIVRPLADGGEGTVDALVSGMNGSIHHVMVTGPLGNPVSAKYGIIEESKTAVIEMSQAAGITLLKEELRNPFYTTTYGVGELIRDGISRGCRRFIIGIGGSATNDGGVGMLQALGYEFLDERGMPAAFGAKGLEKLKLISDTHVLPELKLCEFHIACDVSNPLCGKHGCSAVYGPQKGADESMIAQMDLWLKKYARLAKKLNPKADDEKPGTGAAGGLGFAFLTFLNGKLESGIQIVLQETKLEQYMKEADIVITGEGRLDEQTAMGKAPIGVARLAKKYKKPVIGVAGSVTKGASLCNDKGMDAFFPIVRSIVTLEQAMDREQAAQNMTDTVEQIFRLIHAVENMEG